MKAIEIIEDTYAKKKFSKCVIMYLIFTILILVISISTKITFLATMDILLICVVSMLLIPTITIIYSTNRLEIYDVYLSGSSAIKSKYRSVFGKFKIPWTDISYVTMDKNEFLKNKISAINIFDKDKKLIAQINVSVFSSAQYLENVKSLLESKNINVYVETNIKSEVNEPSNFNISSVSDSNTGTITTTVTSSGRRRNIKDNTIQPLSENSSKSGKHKGRKLEL